MKDKISVPLDYILFLVFLGLGGIYYLVIICDSPERIRVFWREICFSPVFWIVYIVLFIWAVVGLFRKRK